MTKQDQRSINQVYERLQGDEYAGSVAVIFSIARKESDFIFNGHSVNSFTIERSLRMRLSGGIRIWVSKNEVTGVLSPGILIMTQDRLCWVAGIIDETATEYSLKLKLVNAAP